MNALDEARAALAEWDAAPPVFLGGQRARVNRVVDALRDLIRECEAMDRLLRGLPKPPTDDEREALADLHVFATTMLYPGSDYPVKAVAWTHVLSWFPKFRRQGPITEARVEAAKWAIARGRFERAGVVTEVDQRDADMCEEDARAALKAAEDASWTS